MNIRTVKAAGTVAIISLGLTSNIYAEAAEDKKSVAEIIKEVEIDMPSSTAPAVFLLGASGETVPRTTSFREFSTQVARAFDERGKASNAIAVELAPYLALSDITWADLKDHPFRRIMARTNLSLANKVGGDDSPRQSAVGLQSVLYSVEQDAAIAKGHSPECTIVAGKIKTLAPPRQPPKDKDELQSALRDQKRKEALQPLAEEIDACQREIDFFLKKWNQTMVSVGVGRVFSSSSNTTNAARGSSNDPSAYWITASYAGDILPKGETTLNKADPDRNYGYMLTGHFRRMTHTPTVTSSGSDTTANMKLWGANLRYGTAKSALIAEYSRAKFDGLAQVDSRKRMLVGFERRLAKELYLTVGVARDTGVSQDKQSILAKLNWGISKTPQFIKEAEESK